MKKAILIGISCIIVLIGIWAFSSWMHYNNVENKTRNRAEAQRQNIENCHDEMFKIINQKAKVPVEYRSAFKEIFVDIMNERYGAEEDGSLLKFVKEHNPEFDVSLYKDLMNSIEIERIKFAKEQTRMLDIIREHTNLLTTRPSKWFITNKEIIEYTVISSTYSKEVIQSGIDNQIELF